MDTVLDTVEELRIGFYCDSRDRVWPEAPSGVYCCVPREPVSVEQDARNAALEEAAKVTDEIAGKMSLSDAGPMHGASAAIRALKRE